MTWSIVGVIRRRVRRRRRESLLCRRRALPAVRSGVGALSTQALVNPLYGALGLELWRGGAPVKRCRGCCSPRRTTHAITASCTSSMRRDESAATPGRLHHWCGRLRGATSPSPATCWPGPQVLERDATAYMAPRQRTFAERLLDALDAGDAAGGDKRGKQAAAPSSSPPRITRSLDLRVDDHEEPFIELRRLQRQEPRALSTVRGVSAAALTPRRHHRSRGH